MMATHQFVDEKSDAGLMSEIPIRAIVGAIARGPMKRKSIPTNPHIPMITSNKEATIMAPWTYNVSKSFEICF